jgi:hypothetical protein
MLKIRPLSLSVGSISKLVIEITPVNKYKTFFANFKLKITVYKPLVFIEKHPWKLHQKIDCLKL